MKISEAILLDTAKLTELFASWWNSRKSNGINLDDPDVRQMVENYVGMTKDKSLLFDEAAADTSTDWESFLWNVYTNRQGKGPIDGEITYGSSSFSADDSEDDEDFPTFGDVTPESSIENTDDEPAPQQDELEDEKPEDPEDVTEEAEEPAEVIDEPEETAEPEPAPAEESVEQLPQEIETVPAVPVGEENATDVFDYVEALDDEPEAPVETEDPAPEPAEEEIPDEEDSSDEVEEEPVEEIQVAEEPESVEEPAQEQVETETPAAEAAEDIDEKEVAATADTADEKAAAPVEVRTEKPHTVKARVQEFLFTDEEMGIVRQKAAKKLSLPVARHHAFDDALFALRSGLKVHLYGAKGSGRSTLARQLEEECGIRPSVGDDKESGCANFLVDYDEKLESEICPEAHSIAVGLRAAGTPVTLAQCIVIEKLLPLGQEKAISAI